MKYLSLFGIPLFILFALVQINDPDPYIWIPVYLLPAYISFLVFKGKYPILLMSFAALTYLLFSIITFPPSLGQWISDELNNGSLSMKTATMEEARESLGSLICFVFLAVYSIYYLLAVKNNPTT